MCMFGVPHGRKPKLCKFISRHMAVKDLTRGVPHGRKPKLCKFISRHMAVKNLTRVVINFIEPLKNETIGETRI